MNSFKQYIAERLAKSSRLMSRGSKTKLDKIISRIKAITYSEKPNILWGAEGKRGGDFGDPQHHEEGEECIPGDEYCSPFQNQGPDNEVDPDPDHPADDHWGEYYEWMKCVAAGGANCGDSPRTPNMQTCQPWPSCADETRTPQPDPPRPFNWHNVKPTIDRGPDGPEGPTDDLFDPWKYRGVTNEYMLNPPTYRQGLD